MGLANPLLSRIIKYIYIYSLVGFLGGLDSKESACNAEDLGSIPRMGRSPEEGNGYPLQYSGLDKSMERRVW